MGDLMRDHWAEVGSHQNVRAMQIPRDKYATLEAQGALLSLFAYDDEGRIVGYSTNVVTMNMHAADCRFVQNDALYLAKDHRKGLAGVRLMKETEKAAKRLGAKLMVWHAKESTGLDKLLPLLGYGVLDVMYSKEI